MHVIMTTSLCGPELSLASNDPYECDEVEAGRLIEAGFARLPDEQQTDPAAVSPQPARRRGPRTPAQG